MASSKYPSCQSSGACAPQHPSIPTAVPLPRRGGTIVAGSARGRGAMAGRDEIISYCDERLRAAAFHDAAINGLQVDGYREIDKLAVAVSASRLSIEEAAAWGADALLVHHG